MTDHPITPPPELVQQWDAEAATADMPDQVFIATQAARWGSDQELEACLQWFSEFYCMETWMQKDLEKFRLARRPKPPSLKEQALAIVTRGNQALTSEEQSTIRRALELLDD